MAKHLHPVNDVQLAFNPDTAVTIDVNAINDLQKNHGVTFVHYRALRCPMGLIDRYDTRKPDNCNLDCSNGFLYRKAGVFTGVFTSNNRRESSQDYGLLQSASSQLTVPVYYDNSNARVHLCRYDRLYIDSEQDILVENWETTAVNINSNTDKLQFPATVVTDLIDNTGKEYKEKQDFVLNNGRIQWINSPGIDPSTGQGRIYSVRYSYVPFYYVAQFLHEIRVQQTNYSPNVDDYDHPVQIDRQVTQLPYHVELQREYFFEKETINPDSPKDNPRALPSPIQPTFGAR